MSDGKFFTDASRELARARDAYTPFASAHEGYAVMLEEVDELWSMVRLRPGQRDPVTMRRECVQIAAMAARFAIELCETDVVNVR